MRFKEGAAVYSVDDELVGHIERFVMDCTTKEITHVIVRQGYLYKNESRVIPVGWIGAATDHEITLYCRAAQLYSGAGAAEV